jgi:serine/threonine protein kinase
MDIPVGSVVDGRYRVTGLCSDAGDMGSILHVEPIFARPTRRLVLKFCKVLEAELVARFRREIRLLSEFAGDPRVVEVLDKNLNHDPPYFVMPFYEHGDLTVLSRKISADHAIQERLFLAMIECVEALHARNVYHRDIKPQNFLIDGSSIRISDLGLSTEVGSDTAMTRSSVFWGTHGFMPPEFIEDRGFKNASAAADIFMLGKSIYALLTGRDPTYLIKGLPELVWVNRGT